MRARGRSLPREPHEARAMAVICSACRKCVVATQCHAGAPPGQPFEPEDALRAQETTAMATRARQ